LLKRLFHSEHYATSDDFKLKSNMRSKFRDQIKDKVSKTGDHGLRVEQIQLIKENICATLDKSITDKTIEK